MDAYVRVDKKKDDSPIQENEVRIMAANKMRNYISYAIALLTEKGHSSVQLKAMGRAINKTVTIAEILKRRVPGLHQITEIGSVDMTDTWEPKEEGLNRLEITRHVSVMTVTLSMSPLDTTHPGYQAPLPEDQIKPQQMEGEEGVPQRRGRARARRGGRGGQQGAGNESGDTLQDGSVPVSGERHPRGRGRGRRQGRGGAAVALAAEGQHIGVVLAEQALPPAPAMLPVLPAAPL